MRAGRLVLLDLGLAGFALAGCGWCVVAVQGGEWGDSPLPLMGVIFLAPAVLVPCTAAVGLYRGSRWGVPAHWLATRWSVAVGLLAAAVLIAAW